MSMTGWCATATPLISSVSGTPKAFLRARKDRHLDDLIDFDFGDLLGIDSNLELDNHAVLVDRTRRDNAQQEIRSGRRFVEDSNSVDRSFDSPAHTKVEMNGVISSFYNFLTGIPEGDPTSGLHRERYLLRLDVDPNAKRPRQLNVPGDSLTPMHRFTTNGRRGSICAPRLIDDGQLDATVASFVLRPTVGHSRRGFTESFDFESISIEATLFNEVLAHGRRTTLRK